MTKKEEAIMSFDEEVARVAYELFERDGRTHGKDREHWLEAVEIVNARHAAEEPLKKGKRKSPESTTGVTKKAPAVKKSSPKPAASASKEKTKEQKK
jgi:hypothetical protein